MSDDAERELRQVQAYFRLPGLSLVEKDLHVVRAIAALAALDASPFTLVFGGGTALARAHKLVRRMSEDVDFKIVPHPATAVSRSILRQQLSTLRHDITAALLAAGFDFDPKDPAQVKSRNESRYTILHLPYARESGAAEGLRPTIQLELTYAELRHPPVMLPVSSFIAEAYQRPPEVSAIACVSLTETAAEKLVALTRRTAMELAGLTRGDPDPALVRHIYDLHILRQHIDPTTVAVLARGITLMDAAVFGNQYRAYRDDHAGETRKALAALQTDPVYRRRYDHFVSAMVYGEKVSFDSAITAVKELAAITLGG